MKNKLKQGIAKVIIVTSFLPFLACAENTNKTIDTAPKITRSSVNFCARLSTINTKLADEIKIAEEKQSKYQNSRVIKITKKESDANSKHVINKAKRAARRAKNWDKIINKAKTDEQKLAVNTYKTTIQTAIDNNQMSIDSAVKTYKFGLTAIIDINKNSTNGAVSSFETIVDNALEKAKTDCLNNNSSKTVNTEFTKKINEAKDVLKITKKAVETRVGITALKKTRDESIKLSENALKDEIEKARAGLVVALKN